MSNGPRDWATPTVEMMDMLCRSAITLRAACADLNLPVSGSKRVLVGRLLDAGMTAARTQAEYGYLARRARAQSGF